MCGKILYTQRDTTVWKNQCTMFLATVQHICGCTEPAHNASCDFLDPHGVSAGQNRTKYNQGQQKMYRGQVGECTLPSRLSLWDTRVGNLPALFKPGPNRRGICLMTVSLAKKALYFLAAQAQQSQLAQYVKLQIDTK